MEVPPGKRRNESLESKSFSKGWSSRDQAGEKRGWAVELRLGIGLLRILAGCRPNLYQPRPAAWGMILTRGKRAVGPDYS